MPPFAISCRSCLGPRCSGPNGALANGRSQPMEMIREGLLRLWVICTILFLAAVGAWFYRPFEKEFHRADLAEQIRSSATPLVPIACGEARGASGSDYLSDVDDGNCWYALPKFRANYPEYERLADQELVTTMVRKVGWLGGPPPPLDPAPGAWCHRPRDTAFCAALGLGGAAAGRAALPAPRRHSIGPRQEYHLWLRLFGNATLQLNLRCFRSGLLPIRSNIPS